MIDEVEFQEGECEMEVIELLVEQEELEGAALGIAKIILDDDKGLDALSPAQLAVYENIIRPRLRMTCSICDCQMSAADTLEAMQEWDEYCNYCRHILEEDDDE